MPARLANTPDVDRSTSAPLLEERSKGDDDATAIKGGHTLSSDQEIQREDFAIPEYAASRGTRLDRILARASDAPLRVGNRLTLLKNGPATYEDWLQAISKAKHWIHLDNYIFENDEIGNK